MRCFTHKCPVEPEDKEWLEESMLWLVEEFGADVVRDVTVVLPTDDFFPDRFSENEDDLRILLDRVCGYMGVDPERVELNIFTDESAGLRRGMPFFESSRAGVAGRYRERRGRFIVSIESSQASIPMNLIATIAHELGHARLLGEARVSGSYEDHEPLTDLLTVFLGMGVFTGNSVFHFRQWTDTFSQGWQTERRGYMTEEMYGYALASFAWMRGEGNPNWAGYLEGNVAAYFKSGRKYIEKIGDTRLIKL